MLAIKLQRTGKKHQPSYRLVVAEKRSKMAAPPVEDLGSYSPRTKQANVNAERASYWLGVGAQPTVTVHNLFVKQGVLKSPKIQMKFKVVEKPAPAAAAPASKPAEVPTQKETA
ncbi:MAG: hypothetical protein RL681_63 [Candidatus Parcubacteria bacterium]|jgi:small subunit ribosomal protein S16